MEYIGKEYNQVTGRIFDIQKFSIHDGQESAPLFS